MKYIQKKLIMLHRKDFLKLITAGLVTGSLASVIQSCKKDDDDAKAVDFTLDLSAAANSALLNNGGSVISNSVIVINNGGAYVALSDICTHQSCALSYNNSQQKLQCPCHGSAFNLSGSVLNGPASSSLKKYTVSQNGNVLHVTG